MGIFSAAEEKVKTKKIKEEGCVVTLQIEVPPAKVAQARQTTLVRLQSQAKLPGFRPGKAPLDLVRSQFDGAARERVLDQLVRETLPKALEEHKLRPIAAPGVHSIKMEEGKPLVFQVDVEIPPLVQPKNYKKLPVTAKKYPVTEEDIAKKVEELREGNARLEKALQDSAQKEHYVVIDYEASAEGKPLKNGKGSDELVDLSAPGTVEGLTEGLIGAKMGETREVPVKIGGKPALFKTTVKDIKKKMLPELDDEFAKDIGYGSLLELRGKIRELLEEEGKRKSEREFVAQIEEALLKANPFPVPPALVEDSLERLTERLREQVLGKRDWPAGEKDKVGEKLRPRAEQEVRLAFLLRAVAQTEKIEVNQQDMEAEKAELLKSAQSEEDRQALARHFEENAEAIKAALLDRKVVNFLKSSAAVTEA